MDSAAVGELRKGEELTVLELAWIDSGKGNTRGKLLRVRHARGENAGCCCANHTFVPGKKCDADTLTNRVLNGAGWSSARTAGSGRALLEPKPPSPTGAGRLPSITPYLQRVHKIAAEAHFF